MMKPKSLQIKLGVEYIETSCKTGENIKEAFYKLIAKVLKHNNWDHNEKANPFILQTNKEINKDHKDRPNCCVILS